MKIKRSAYLGLLIFCSTLAVAQADMQSDRQRIQDFKVWKLTSIMNLPTDQNDKFISLAGDLEVLSNNFIDTKQGIIRRIDPLLDAHNPDQGQIDRLLGDLDKEEENYLRKKADLEKTMFRLLTPAQHANYIKFQMEFPRMLRDIARERAVENRRANFRR